MNYIDILTRVKNNNINGVFLFYGREKFLLNHVVNLIGEKFDGDFADLNINKFKAGSIDINDVINACETIPVFDNKKLVIIDEIELGKMAIEKNKKLFEDLIKYLPKIAEYISLILISDDEKPFAGKFFKYLKDKHNIVNLEKLNRAEFSSFIKTKIKRSEKTISNENFQYLIHCLNYLDKDSKNTLYIVDNEVDKLIQYMGGIKIIEKEMIDKIFIKSIDRNIFDFLNSIIDKKPKIALEYYIDMRKTGNSFSEIFYMLLRQTRNYLKVKILVDKKVSIKDGIREAGLSPFEYNKILSKVKNMNLMEIKYWHDNIYELENKWKKISIDEDLEMEILISKMIKI